MSKIERNKFYFVRHGTTDWNARQLCQGQLDIELNEAGRLEAGKLGEFIKKFPLKRICASPLKRALETANILQSFASHCELQIIDELKERNWGQLEGISSVEMYRIEELEEKKLPTDPDKGVETREAFQNRVLTALTKALNCDDAPLIVSHGRVFLTICELLNVPLIRQIPNTTLIECCPTKNGWQINLMKS